MISTVVEKLIVLRLSLRAAAVALQEKQKFEEILNQKLSGALFLKQTEQLESKLVKALIPVFVAQVEAMGDRLSDLSGGKSAAENLARQMISPAEWNELIVDTVFPILAAASLAAAKIEADQIEAAVKDLV